MALWKETTQDGPVEKSVLDEPARAVPPPPKREIFTPRERHESVFGTGVLIEGKIEGDGDVRIAGRFKGDIQIKGDLNIEKGARLTAKVNAENVTIGGELEGNIVAHAQVKLLESGQLVGDLKASTLTVAAGSRMRGHVEFGWPASESARMDVKPQSKTGATG
ncbi:MAG TPA: polymer-forming cytoskeletal protein [Candidatus Eisenbacteria bacterium]|nr:polymer-forming cytoskeletal protein [Candidatus Eisenbacteria bacterium]